MSATLLIPLEELTSGTAVGSGRLPKIAPGTAVAVQVDTEVGSDLLLSGVTIELRNTHPGAVGGGGWVDYSAEIDVVGANLTATQGSASYNFSLHGHEEIRVTCTWASGSGDISATISSVP